MARATEAALFILLFLLVVSTFSAGHEVVATADSTAVVLVGHGSRPAIHPAVSRGHFSSPVFSTGTSTNWSGYVVLPGMGSVTDVNGSWIQPSVSCSGSSSYSAFWVGIDGFSQDDSTVEQIGTESDCQGGVPVYYAWYEFYGFPSIVGAGSNLIESVPVLPGDVISAEVSCQADGLRCTVSITDVTSGESFSYTQAFPIVFAPRLSSAEWVVEAPSTTSNRILPLADFGTVYFGQDETGVSSSDSATVNGISGPTGSFGEAVVEVTMVSEKTGSIEAQPTGLSSDGTSFSVDWGSGSSTAALTAGEITPASPTTGVGEPIQLTANPSGGVPPYAITWRVSAEAGMCSTSDGSVASGSTYTPSPTASTYYCYTVADSANPPSSADSPTDLVTVLLPLYPPVISVSPPEIGEGQSAAISTVTAFTGGAPPYTCLWLEEPPSAANFSDLGFSFTDGCTQSSKPSASTGAMTEKGNWAFELQVTDGRGATVVSSPAKLVVNASIGPVLTASCSPTPVVVGSATQCEATVEEFGSAVPTGSIAWTSSSQGKFSQTSCKLSEGACSVKFTPTAAGSSVILLASYGGDSTYSLSSATYTLTVTVKASKTTVSCYHHTALAPFACEAKVSGFSPTGTVSWSQEGNGTVSPANETCTLLKGSCSVTLTGDRPGDLTVNASYGGDLNNEASSATHELKVAKKSTTVTMECASRNLVVGRVVRCEATVGGYSPTGTVTWSKVSGSGRVTFSSKTCTLSSGSCWVTITATAAGSLEIRATYGGDPNNIKSSGTLVLTLT